MGRNGEIWGRNRNFHSRNARTALRLSRPCTPLPNPACKPGMQTRYATEYRQSQGRVQAGGWCNRQEILLSLPLSAFEHSQAFNSEGGEEFNQGWEILRSAWAGSWKTRVADKTRLTCYSAPIKLNVTTLRCARVPVAIGRPRKFMAAEDLSGGW